MIGLQDTTNREGIQPNMEHSRAQIAADHPPKENHTHTHTHTSTVPPSVAAWKMFQARASANRAPPKETGS
jgi:hypothetical protein